jgi:hypothetical protein
MTQNENKTTHKDIYSTSGMTDNPPYHDVTSAHLCIYKRVSLLKNFTRDQDPREDTLRLDALDKKHLKRFFCGICHKLKTHDEFSIDPPINLVEILRKRPIDSMDNLSMAIKRVKITHSLKPANRQLGGGKLRILANKLKSDRIKKLYNILLKLSDKLKKITTKWRIFTLKLLEPKILYNISKYETLIIPEGRLTPYQRFRLSNPTYKTDGHVFNKGPAVKSSYIDVI